MCWLLLKIVERQCLFVQNDKNIVKVPHSLTLDNRKKLEISGVLNVDSFDEQNIIAYTDLGELSVKGKNLHISKLNLENGELIIQGNISSMVYANKNSKKKQGMFSKFFK